MPVCAAFCTASLADVLPLEVVGVRVEMPSNQPIVLLRETDGERYLPIWIGAPEASAIALAQQGVTPPRPLTHDLLRDVVAALGAQLVEVRITDLSEGVFYAVLVFDTGVEISARPSDAIALALRTGAPIIPIGITVAREVMPPEAKVPKMRLTVTIRFGRPIDVARYADRADDRLVLRQIIDEVM